MTGDSGYPSVLISFFITCIFQLNVFRRIYPQRPSGQDVVTGGVVLPPPPVYVPSCLSRRGLTVPLFVDFDRILQGFARVMNRPAGQD